MVIFSEVPVLSQGVLQEVLAGTRRYPKHTVVSAHDAAYMSFLDASLERCEVMVGKVLQCGIVVVAVAASLEIVHCVMPTGRDDLLVKGIIALHSWNEVADVVPDMVSIFAGSPLAATPTRIAEAVRL